MYHCTDANAPKGFITKDYTKPTAMGQVFINGKSHHPLHVFKGIVIGESKRLRRLNENDDDYQNSIHKLKDKCLRSDFNHELVNQTINKTLKWKRNAPKKNDKKVSLDATNTITWTTQFKNILRINKKEKMLEPKAVLTFCRPPTIGNHLTNYKNIATRNNNSLQDIVGSYPCNSCGLCGNRGKLSNMVLATKMLLLRDGKKISIKSYINCKSNGIYAARCKVCLKLYVGQTKNPFSTRWNTHRHNWKQISQQGNTASMASKSEYWKEQNALFLHYSREHQEQCQEALLLSDAYEVIFIEKTKPSMLNIREHYWIVKLNATINIAKTYLPKYK